MNARQIAVVLLIAVNCFIAGMLTMLYFSSGDQQPVERFVYQKYPYDHKVKFAVNINATPKVVHLHYTLYSEDPLAGDLLEETEIHEIGLAVVRALELKALVAGEVRLGELRQKLRSAYDKRIGRPFIEEIAIDEFYLE